MKGALTLAKEVELGTAWKSSTELEKEFWDNSRGQMKRTVKVLPEDSSEHQMEDYLGLKWCEQTDAMGSTGAPT